MLKMAVHIQQDWKWNTGIIWALQLLHSPYSHYQSYSSLYEVELHVRHINTTHEIRIVNIPTAKCYKEIIWNFLKCATLY